MTTEARLPPARRTLPHMLRLQAERFGGRPAVKLGGRRWSHDEVAGVAARRAGALQALGVGRGDSVAVMSGNRPEFLEVFLACGWMGAVSVPINTASQGPQIEYFLANSRARLLVVEAQYLPRLALVDWSATSLQAVCVLEDGTPVHADPSWPPAVLPWPDAGDPVEAAPVGPGDALAILYTSGTTGPSKGVLCSHAQYYWWGVNSLTVLGVRAEDVLCTTLPLFHINALNTYAQAALAGCQAVFEGRFSASRFWSSMREHGATVVYLLGAMVPILLAQPEGPAERDHRVRIGLGPGVPAGAAEEFQARTGVLLLEGYGSTETNFVLASTPENPRRGTMGWLLPGFEARVADEDDVEVPPGEAGELLLRAQEPHAFSGGYFQMPEKTLEAWRNLWFHTGDRVVREADGAIRFVDRIKDAIRRRGENISSYEVEQVLLSHPDVATVAVYPVRSELAEDEVMAALVLQAGARLEPAALIEWCELRLQRFAIPRYIDILDELPRTENGKIQKYRLRERGVGPSTWERPQERRRPGS
ncbi:ATP-dependent acyl-CoA ligase [uncultured Castellaniella sp.]|uniref:ATP-dependent acyl-CoA ligase n=1 Tax=uncultured Castellaniella sp. TaxID=647907 RepID=UPI0026074008|nr:ATP-dependent acyl-CoA ligase [uncultured Castellaniella sp.]